jgi:hypothetical protein
MPRTTLTIQEHMEVVDARGKHVGTVDCVEDGTIKLVKTDPVAGGQHHWVPLVWIATVDDVVHLNRDRDQVVREWRSSPAGVGA